MHPDSPWIQSVSTGALVPPACRAWRCDVCGPGKARRMGVAIDRAGYDRWVVIGKPPADLRQGVARLANRLRDGGTFEWVWSFERGPKTGHVHLNAMIRSRYLDNRGRYLRDRCHAAGWGLAWIKKGSTAGGYAAKSAGYAAKEAKSGYPEWRALNGSRPWHWSRRYTAGVPMRDWVREHAPAKDPGPWKMVYARDLPTYEQDCQRWVVSGERYAREWHDQGGVERTQHLVAESLGVELVRRELGAWDYDRAAIARRW